MLKDNNDQISPKIILITGGGGFLGKALIKELLKYSFVEEIIIFSRDELKHHELELEFNYNKKITYFLGDIRDPDRLDMINQKIDTIFHCAALKHVKFSQNNSSEFIKTNLTGTQNLIDFTIKKQIPNFIFFSTDKAVNPANVYGKTKKDAEDLIIKSSFNNPNINFKIIRFGNLLGSTGSIVPTLLLQTKQNKTPNISDLNVTRFTCNSSEVASLAISTLNIKFKNTLIIPKLKCFTLRLLLESLNIKNINLIGLSSDEKKSEMLFSDEEEPFLFESENFLYRSFDNKIKNSLEFKKFKNSNSAELISLIELSNQLNHLTNDKA